MVFTDSVCKELREGIGCGRCSAGFYGAVDCRECKGVSYATSFVLIMIGPFVCMFIYKALTGRATSRAVAATVLVATFGMGSSFMQTIGVMNTFAFTWPDAEPLTTLLNFAKIILLDADGLTVACTYGNKFIMRYMF